MVSFYGIISGIAIFLLIAIIITLGVLYAKKEEVIKYLNSTEYGQKLILAFSGDTIENLRKELTDKCIKEKTDLQTAAESLLKQKLDEKEVEISTLKASNGSLEEISKKLEVCEQEKQKLVDDMNAAFKLETERLQTIINEKDATLTEKEKALKMTIKTPTPWMCGINGLTAPIRVNDERNIECMALDGKNCLWSGTIDNCQKLLTTAKPVEPIVPVKCAGGDSNDYKTDGYWCKLGYYGIGLDK